jgi:hypothetical protein
VRVVVEDKEEIGPRETIPSAILRRGPAGNLEMPMRLAERRAKAGCRRGKRRVRRAVTTVTKGGGLMVSSKR